MIKNDPRSLIFSVKSASIKVYEVDGETTEGFLSPNFWNGTHSTAAGGDLKMVPNPEASGFSDEFLLKDRVGGVIGALGADGINTTSLRKQEIITELRRGENVELVSHFRVEEINDSPLLDAANMSKKDVMSLAKAALFQGEEMLLDSKSYNPTSWDIKNSDHVTKQNTLDLDGMKAYQISLEQEYTNTQDSVVDSFGNKDTKVDRLREIVTKLENGKNGVDNLIVIDAIDSLKSTVDKIQSLLFDLNEQSNLLQSTDIIIQRREEQPFQAKEEALVTFKDGRFMGIKKPSYEPSSFWETGDVSGDIYIVENHIDGAPNSEKYMLVEDSDEILGVLSEGDVPYDVMQQAVQIIKQHSFAQLSVKSVKIFDSAKLISKAEAAIKASENEPGTPSSLKVGKLGDAEILASDINDITDLDSAKANLVSLTASYEQIADRTELRRSEKSDARQALVSSLEQVKESDIYRGIYFDLHSQTERLKTKSENLVAQRDRRFIENMKVNAATEVYLRLDENEFGPIDLTDLADDLTSAGFEQSSVESMIGRFQEIPVTDKREYFQELQHDITEQLIRKDGDRFAKALERAGVSPTGEVEQEETDQDLGAAYAKALERMGASLVAEESEDWGQQL